MTALSPQPIIDVAMGFMTAKQLFVASRVGLFEALADREATLAQLAERLGLPPRTTRILVRAMEALGLIARSGERYRNAALAEAFLSGRGERDLRPALHLWNELTYGVFHSLESAIRTGTSVVEPLDEDQERPFAECVEALTAAPAHALARSYDFGGHHHLLDLGGGRGSFVIAALERHRHLKGTLLELPRMAQIASNRLAASAVGDRVSVVEADFFVDPIPEGHDAVLVAHVLRVLEPEQNHELLRRIREQVHPGARLLLVDYFLDQARAEPSSAALMAALFLVMHGGDVHGEEDVRAWLEAAGWVVRERHALDGPTELMVAEAVG